MYILIPGKQEYQDKVLERRSEPSKGILSQASLWLSVALCGSLWLSLWISLALSLAGSLSLSGSLSLWLSPSLSLFRALCIIAGTQTVLSSW